MWFFFRRWRERRQALTATPTTKPRPLSFQQITDGFGDFSDFRWHNAALKFWLPEPAEQALVEFCGIADQSLSEWPVSYTHLPSTGPFGKRCGRNCGAWCDGFCANTNTRLISNSRLSRRCCGKRKRCRRCGSVGD